MNSFFSRFGPTAIGSSLGAVIGAGYGTHIGSIVGGLDPFLLPAAATGVAVATLYGKWR